MAIQIQLRQGTTTEHNNFKGAVGEVTVDTTKDTLVVHDGITAGGFPVASRANADGTISLIKKDGTSAGTINADGLFNNTLTSSNTNQALTAAQGKILKDSLDASSFGVGQTWQDFTTSRVGGTTYTNSTGKTIHVLILISDTYGVALKVSVGGLSYTAPYDVTPSGAYPFSFPVPNGATYSLSWGADNTGLRLWWEMR